VDPAVVAGEKQDETKAKGSKKSKKAGPADAAGDAEAAPKRRKAKAA
jgi:hypothetical protein